MDFKSGQQLIGLCETNECPISEIMLIREETFTERTRKDIINQMGKTWQIMKESAHSSVENPKHSIGGLIGGEAKLLSEHLSSGKSICKDPLSRAITYSMSILETSASMGLIVAAPTAGLRESFPDCFLRFRRHMISLTTILSVSFLMQGPSAVLPCATLLLPALWAAVRQRSESPRQWPLLPQSN